MVEKSVNLDAINVVLVEEYGNSLGLEFDTALNDIIKSFMVDDFKSKNCSAPVNRQALDYPPTITGVWYSKGSV
jgi:hypothetical protein